MRQSKDHKSAPTGNPPPRSGKPLQQMQGGLSGRLPTLDGFADGGDDLPVRDRYERGYFQASVQVRPTSEWGSVRSESAAKVTAWYTDPQKAHSGYELLHSNGRIEADILDQLSEQLAAAGSQSRSSGAVEVLHAEPSNAGNGGRYPPD